MMKALIVGLGSIGQRHVRNLRAILGDEVELLAYRRLRQAPLLSDSLGAQTGGDIEATYNITTYDDMEAACQQKPDLGFVCNPTSLHMPYAQQLAAAGCHLFLEKPLSHNLDGIEELAATLKQKQRIGYVGYQFRFHPCLTKLKSILDAGTLGPILAVNARIGEYMPGWHKYEDYRGTYAARSDLGGGVILSQIHELDYLTWLFGEPTSVYALGGKLTNMAIDVEDTASILMAFRHGDRVLPVHLHQDYSQLPGEKNAQIIGEHGKATIDLLQNQLSVHLASGDHQTYRFAEFSRNDMFLEQMRHFLDCCAGRAQPQVTIQDGARSLKAALLAKRSLKTGQPESWLPPAAASAKTFGRDYGQEIQP